MARAVGATPDPISLSIFELSNFQITEIHIFLPNTAVLSVLYYSLPNASPPFFLLLGLPVTENHSTRQVFCYLESCLLGISILPKQTSRGSLEDDIGGVIETLMAFIVGEDSFHPRTVYCNRSSVKKRKKVIVFSSEKVTFFFPFFVFHLLYQVLIVLLYRGCCTYWSTTRAL